MEGNDSDDEYSELERQLELDLEEFDDENVVVESEGINVSNDVMDDEWENLLSQVASASNDVLGTYEKELLDCDVLLNEKSPLKTTVVTAWTIDSRLSSISMNTSKESRDILLNDIESDGKLCEEETTHVSKIIRNMDDLLRSALVHHNDDDIRNQIQGILDTMIQSVAFSATICVSREEKVQMQKPEQIQIVIPEEPKFDLDSYVQAEIINNDAMLRVFDEQNLLSNQTKNLPSINFDVVDEETERIKDLDRLKREERKKKQEEIRKQAMMEAQFKQEEERARQEAIAAEMKRLQEIEEEERARQEAIAAEMKRLQEIEEERIKQEAIAAETKRLQEIEEERIKQEAIAAEMKRLQEIEEERIKQEAIAAEMKRLQEIEEERIKQEAIAAEIKRLQEIEEERIKQEAIAAEMKRLQEIEEERIRQEKIAAEMKRQQQIEEERIKQEAIAVASRLSKQAETNPKSAKSVESTKNMLSLSNITKPLTSWGGKFFQSTGSSSSTKSSEVGTAESSAVSNTSAVNTLEKVVDGENNEYKVCPKAQRFREDLLHAEFAYPVVLDTSKLTDSANKVESSGLSQCLDVDKFLISSLNSWKLWKSSVNTDPSAVEMKNFANKPIARATWSVENIPVEVMDTLDKLGLSHTGTSAVESLAINVENIGSVSFLQCFPNLKKLELNVNKLNNLHGLETLTLLTQLSAKDNVLTNLEALAGHVNITDLQLDNNHLSDASVCVLSSILNLTNISLKANQLTRIPAMNSSKLQKLELYNNRITSLEGGQSTLCSLLYLDLGRNSIEFIDGNTLSRCQCLRTLILSQNRLTSLPANLYLPSLKVLWLGGNKISNFSAWIENNSSTVFLPLLEKLFLQDNVITCIDNPCLLACPLLVELDISFNNISSLNAFNGLMYCRKLRHIQVQDNPLVLVPNENILHNNIDIHLTQHSLNDIERHIVSLCPSLSTFCRNSINREKVAANMPDVTHDLPLTECINYPKAMMTKTLRKGHLSFISDDQLPSESDRLIQLLMSIDAEQNNASTLSKSKQDNSSLLEMLKSHLILLERYGLSPNDDINAAVLINYNDSSASNAPEQVAGSLEMKESEQSMLGSSSHNDNSSQNKSAVKIQSVMRGWRSRKNLRHALDSAHYRDDELDELLNMDLNFQFDTEEIMTELNDFDWKKKTNNGDKAESEFNSSPESKLASSDTLMVYGDHRRRRGSNTNNFLVKPASADYSRFVDSDELGSPRPSTAMTDASDLTVSTSAHTEVDGEEYSVRSNSGYSQSHKQSAESVKEWGISDPKVIAMMLKRNKRLKSFEQAKENREKEKDPEVRYQKFVKSTLKNSNQSGSFGGAKKTIKSTRGKKVLPAWAFSNDEYND